MQLNKKTIVRAALCMAVVTALGYSFTVKSETKLLPFQGKLTDANGQVIEDKAIVVQFKMYDAPVGGNAKWNGEVQMLSVNGGLVNTTLGTKASLKNVDFSSPTYLEITIDANGDDQIGPEDPPLLPRQSIIPAVYTVQAGDAKTLSGYDWSSIFGTNDPTGKIPGRKIADKEITATQIANNTITAQQMADSTITGSKIAKGTITSTQIADGAMGTGQIADGAITTAKLDEKAVTTDKIAANSITMELMEGRGAVKAYETVAPIGSVAWSEGIPDGYQVPTTEPNHTKIPGSTVKLKTSGRPVMIMLQRGFIETNCGGNALLKRDNSVDVSWLGLSTVGYTGWTTATPCAAISFIDTPPAGEHEYCLYASKNVSNAIYRYMRTACLVAFEL